MLKHFTWQHFLIAALVFSCIWYLVIILLFYRQKFWSLFNRKVSAVTPLERLRQPWEEELEEEPGFLAEDELMGKPVLPDGVSRIAMNGFGFASGGDDDREARQGLLPDVLQELKTIFHTLEKEGGTKADFFSLFGLVKAKYPSIAGTPNQAALNAFIRAHVLFPVSDEELERLWN